MSISSNNHKKDSEMNNDKDNRKSDQNNEYDDSISQIAGYDFENDIGEDLTKFNKVKRSLYTNRRKKNPLDDVDEEDISYKNPELLKMFLSPHGKIIPPRVNFITHKQQRKLREQIKIAKILNLLSFVKK